MMILDLISGGIILIGLLFFGGAAIGLLRFPDFYTRMHAAGKGDTLSAVFILLGLALLNLHSPSWATLIVSGKILLIAVFIVFTSPTTTHALIQAGYDDGLAPWVKPRPLDSKDP